MGLMHPARAMDGPDTAYSSRHRSVRGTRQLTSNFPIHPLEEPGHRAGLFAFQETSMADYYTQTVVQPTIPNSDMTLLERLLLSNIFSAEEDRDGLYFFAEECPASAFALDRSEITPAIAASAGQPSQVLAAIQEQFQRAGPNETTIDIDLSGAGISHEVILQDIVRRSALNYITIVAAFTCGRMRPDGFGGMAILITKDTIKGKSTND
jgi:hypothetical protein